MQKYIILPDRGHNRVYYDAAGALRLAEARILLSAAGVDAEVAETSVAGVDCAEVTCAELGEAGVRALSRLSYAYMLFRREGETLIPVERELPPTALGPEVSSMLKYSGKTNEDFTRFMLNVALALAGRVDKTRSLRVLDPLAGRGTTLFEAAAAGIDAAGIEISDRDARECATFFKKYLERARLPHTSSREKLGPRDPAPCDRFTFAGTREELRTAPYTLDIATGDASRAAEYYRAGTFDAVVCDLPYGVQHGSVTAGKKSRGPLALLGTCLPAWKKVLRHGGVLAVSWNERATKKSDMLALLRENGFEPQEGGDYERLSHRVEEAIVRDVIFSCPAHSVR